MSTLDVAAAAIRRDERVEIVLLLAFAGGYIDAYTWIIHGVIANIPNLALGLPVVALLIVLLRCEAPHCEVAR